MNNFDFCVNNILKEAKDEENLIKQLLCSILSSYTSNPINLAINAPSGEGKSYVIHKVSQYFPESDVLFLAGMTDKALFHRQGQLVIKDERSGKYESYNDIVTILDGRIEDKLSQLETAKDQNIKQVFRNEIKELETRKKELVKQARKLIDLQHKILIFLDTPGMGLFSTLMPLLSHDKYEVEYEYTDTYNGIKTKTNVLRGFPVIIFAQAIDFSKYERWNEVQRRFIITNPKMSAEKYKAAVNHIAETQGLPDIVFQQKVISDSIRQKVKDSILEIKEQMIQVSSTIDPGKNNTLIPFYEIIKELLPKEKASDMTVANRIFGYLSLLPLVNYDERPRIELRKKGDIRLQLIPLALFEDFRETISLMDYGDGIRPYVLRWYFDIFIQAYDSKLIPESRLNYRGDLETESRLAVTTEELIVKTHEVYAKNLSSKQLLETYIYPLINQGYIDKVKSKIDRRANIYFPVITSPNTNLFDIDDSNKLLQQRKAKLKNNGGYPSRNYLISKIREVLNCYSKEEFPLLRIKNHTDQEISLERLVDIYYSNPEEFFYIEPNTVNLQTATEDYFNVKQKEVELQKSSSIEGNSITSDQLLSRDLFEGIKSNNLIYNCYYCDRFQGEVRKEYERHIISKHSGKPAYPSKADLKRDGINFQNKPWET